MRSLSLALLVVSLIIFAALPMAHAEDVVPKNVVLLDASKTGITALEPQTAKLSATESGILVETEADGQWPGFNMGKRNWNLAHCNFLMIEVTNLGDQSLLLHCRLDSPNFDTQTMQGTITQSFEVTPGKTEQHTIPLPLALPQPLREKIFAMRGAPGGGSANTHRQAQQFYRNNIIGLTLFLNNPGKETKWSVSKIVALADTRSQQPDWFLLPPEQFFPMIDIFGQFKYENWRGKVASEEELQKNIALESEDLAKHPFPPHRNQYGGYVAPTAPQLEATGHFRVQKIDGKWWFIDPEGRLFWSHGVDCVNDNNGTTPITDREFYFTDLPSREDSKFRGCYSQGNWAPHNYYEGKGSFQQFNFTRSNLIRKYGDDWITIFSDLTHKRLRSWGMNTIANWSDGRIYGQRKTPYTATINSGGRNIEGSTGYWGKFPDPFSREFADAVKGSAEWIARTTADDPWCIGYFVDNELSWGGERSLAVSTVMSSPEQPAKLAFLEVLKEQYGEVDNLNKVWGTQFSDWDAFLNARNKPNESNARADLDIFHRQVCEQYFRVIRETLKRVAPNKLYLGCRFAWANEPAARASEKYCDVISYNIYKRTLEDFQLPDGVDKPVVIGEFHFGALDRGMFHTGLVPTDSQEKRAEAYDHYVRSGLEHPHIVGTHWFQYGDQATTGRFDGENYQIGLVNIVDTPYAETIEALRRVGYNMYDIRLNAENK